MKAEKAHENGINEGINENMLLILGAMILICCCCFGF
jgi:hypothetical protein